ncbi:phosphate acetyltransferase [Cellulomonas carbonis]|uniref:Phosphate acetyltransferase n=1 Tax=Cellulomonas carbonis T26 TaxID=947969 RepID=A0A0A0BJU5_9CELL|nr:phosphate acetyltransferase [Cellulomonas carbonis]KGM08768.1 phosphate acetyltransferase [Cellulomonas carbonis T26]GGC10487.1 phosphate acetyltransferase [Cellulomonas carbonis]
MARSIYITSAEGDTGKSTIALGVLDLLSRSVLRVGVFRPVARSTDQADYVLELLLAHDGVDLTYDDCVGVTYEEVHADPEAALSRIVNRYHEVERSCDVVVIVGTDYTDVAGPTELSYNARIAANLGAPVLAVVRAAGRRPEDVRQVADVMVGELRANHAEVIGVVANRCEPAQLVQVKHALGGDLPAWALPDDQLLSAPTVRALMEAVGGRLEAGDEELLSREALDLLVGAMSVEHLLEKLTDGAVIITPGDRSDVLLGLLMAHAAEGFPSLAGIILNGGFYPPSVIARLVNGLGQRLPIIRTELGTFRSANAAAGTRGRLTADSQRKVDTALALFERHVDGETLLARLDVARPSVVTPLMFEYQLLDRARSDRKHIVLPEGNDDRILRAASTLLQRQVARLTILGNEAAIRARATELGLDISAATIVDPKEGELAERFAHEYAELRKHKGMTVERAREIVSSVSYFGTLMVQLGLADGMVSGAVHTTAHTIKPAFEIIKTVPGTSIVSSVFLMGLEDRVLVYGDAAVNPDPTAEQLADIAISSAQTAAQFGIEPRIAMLSYSTGESGTGPDVEKVRAATALVRERRPDLDVEGPIQYDAAVDASVAKTKMPDSTVAGRATVFIFPDLNTGNNTYKAVQRSAGAVAIGPVLQGLRKPVNDLSRGALVQDIVNTVAITAIQAQALAAATAADAATAAGDGPATAPADVDSPTPTTAPEGAAR